MNHRQDWRRRQGAEIRAKRRDLKLTLEDVATFVANETERPVSPQAVSSWERGKYSPTVDHQVAICKLLGVRHSELFGLDEVA